MTFTDFAGGTTGSLFPTGHRADFIDGVEVSCVDAGVCAVLMRAADLGLTGGETPAEINANADLLSRVERIRLRAGELMGMGDVAGKVVPPRGVNRRNLSIGKAVKAQEIAYYPVAAMPPPDAKLAVTVDRKSALAVTPESPALARARLRRDS